jgi:hypothetical protein
MKKLFLIPIIVGLAAIALSGQADARQGGCVHFVGHGGMGAAAGLCIWSTPAE